MGCSQCSPRQKYENNTEKLQTSLLAPTLHYSINFVPQPAHLSNYKRDDIETLYKYILTPFQVKTIPFSNTRFLDPNLPYEPEDNNFDSVYQDLHSELISDSKTWPLNTSNSIFVFLNEGKVVKLKAIIAGSECTPYAHGLFEFELTFHDYPNSPPKVTFLTTGGNEICFGPLLGKTGKVRLPILGNTYSSHKEEEWSPDKGVSEILFALQGLLKTNNLCENEMELQTFKVDEEARRRMNKACGNIVKCCNIQYAMLNYLKCPAPWLRDFIHTYFYLKKDIILKECQKWLTAAENDDALYETFGSLYNPKIAAKLANGNYQRKLKRLVSNLERELSKIKIHIDSPLLETLGQTTEIRNELEEESREEGRSQISYGTYLSEDPNKQPN